MSAAAAAGAFSRIGRSADSFIGVNLLTDAAAKCGFVDGAWRGCGPEMRTVIFEVAEVVAPVVPVSVGEGKGETEEGHDANESDA